MKKKINKKAFYKQGWFWLVVLIFISLAGAFQENARTTDVVETSQDDVENGYLTGKEIDYAEDEDEVDEEITTNLDIPTEFKSALKKAELYSNTMYMSKIGLYNQLTSEYGEKFSSEAAQYAIDNVNADWNANALEKAKSYQETMSMSPESIRDQLTSEHGENFTQEEADFAIQNLS